MNAVTPTALADAIVYTAAYADVFEYPLTAAELHRYLIGVTASPDMLEDLLGEKKILTQTGRYYTLPGREQIAALRAQREQNSRRLWPKATYFSTILANLPFIRMLAITGSLAVNNVEDDADVDFLIVTAPGRLWLARAAVLSVARFAALAGVRLCPNYLISEQALVFPNQTLYAAHELFQMVPLFGMDVYWQICRLNSWREQYLPNAQGLPPAATALNRPVRGPRFQPGLEKLLPPALCDRIERWEMGRKIERLSREQRFSPESAFSADFCKGHDRRHAQRTQQLLQDRMGTIALELQR